MEFHASVIGFVQFLFYFIIAGFFMRYLAARLHDTPWGEALLFIH